MELIEGDTIVMGSDGLFDNVFDHEIISTTSRCKDVIESGTCFYHCQICFGGISNSARILTVIPFQC